MFHMLMMQQGGQPSGPLDGLITPATLLMLILGALAPFAKRIALAALKVIESGAGMVEERQRERKIKTDAIELLTQQNKALHDRETEQASRADRAVDVSIEANKAVLKLTDEKVEDVKRIAALEKQLTDALATQKILELRLAAAIAWNKPDLSLLPPAAPNPPPVT